MSVTDREQRSVPLLTIAAVVLVGLAAAAVLFVSGGETLASNEVALPDLEESQYGVVYLEDYNVFVVATDKGPIALVGDAQHVPDDPVWYCPLSDWFEGPYHGARFDRLGRYANGPPRSDMDRVALEITDETIIVDVDTVIASTGRSPVADPPKGPNCGGLSDDPGFFPAVPLQ